MKKFINKPVRWFSC